MTFTNLFQLRRISPISHKINCQKESYLVSFQTNSSGGTVCKNIQFSYQEYFSSGRQIQREGEKERERERERKREE